MGNMTSHAKTNEKADMKPKVKMGSKMADARRRRLPHGSRSDKK